MIREFNPSSCTITNGNITCDGQSLDYTVDGQAPTSGTISFNNGVISGYQLYISGYTVTKSESTITTTKGEPTIEFNGTYVVAGPSDTHKGIVYLDPTDLTTTCNEEIESAGSSGCMKFYIYDDTGDTYKMIIDHDATEAIYIGEIQPYFNWITENWVGNPRLITADEIAHIVGVDSSSTLKWNSSKRYVDPFDDDVALLNNTDDYVGWYYLDGSGNSYSDWQTQTANGTTKSSYAWLYDNLWNCAYYGCNVGIGSAAYAYYTSTPIINENYTVTVYYTLNHNGTLGFIDEAASIRPVITLPKSIFN